MLTNMIIVIFLSLVTNYCCIVDGRITSIAQDLKDLDFERELNLINKPSLKTIQKDGHIVDCIDINKQPAFDNPLLKNHKIQLKPSFKVTNTKPATSSSIEIEDDLCPKGTIPIRRMTKDDLIRSKQLSDMNFDILDKEIPGRHYAGLNLNQSDPPYVSIGGAMSVYSLPIDNKDQLTSAYIYLSTGGLNDRNVVMAGWEIHPKVFGNAETYFFLRWVDKSQNKGCTNLICSGFVQTEGRYYLSKPVANTSIYSGNQFEMKVEISNDPETNNWWVALNNIYIGYFPPSLFSNSEFAKLGAKFGGWTGMTSTPTGVPSPPMGSGDFPSRDISRTCYMRQMTFQTKNTFRSLDPENYKYVVPYADNPDCFGVKYETDISNIVKHVMVFGGPGGECGD